MVLMPKENHDATEDVFKVSTVQTNFMFSTETNWQGKLIQPTYTQIHKVMFSHPSVILILSRKYLFNYTDLKQNEERMRKCSFQFIIHSLYIFNNFPHITRLFQQAISTDISNVKCQTNFKTF